jgi:transposase-like protein
MMRVSIKEPAMNFAQLSKLTEDQAREYLESVRWGANGERRVCPHCMGTESIKLAGKSTRPGVYKCKRPTCRKQFTVTVGSVMERGHIKIRIWLLALHLMSASKKGISAHQLHRMLGVTYKTAWFMAHRIRYAMQQEPLAGMLKGEIEADETYVGARKLRYPGVGAYQKKAVALLVERGGRAHAMPVNEVTTKTLREELFHLADRDSTLFTDELPVYVRIGREFRGGHHRSLHKHREYVRRTPNGEVLVTTNTAESFFSLLKRAHVGTFHQLSKKHLHRYTTEFSFRWNHRKVTDGQRMVAAIKGAEWQRLMYREPVRKTRKPEHLGDGQQ